jgi:predicted DsbA family dithiol-disulfide isomerase
MHVEIWSDVVCPWCYIGKRRFERALDQLDGLDVQVTYRPYQLDPRAPTGSPSPVFDAYARKFGGPERAEQILSHVTSVAAADGIAFRMDRALRANTFAAHRLLWLAEQPDSPAEQSALKERLLQAYFHDGLDVGDHDVLAVCAADVGFDRHKVTDFLRGDGGSDEVRSMLASAHEHGITAVPTFVIDGTWAIPGAQDPDTFVQVLRRMEERAATGRDNTGRDDTGRDDNNV